MVNWWIFRNKIFLLKKACWERKRADGCPLVVLSGEADEVREVAEVGEAEASVAQGKGGDVEGELGRVGDVERGKCVGGDGGAELGERGRG